MNYECRELVFTGGDSSISRCTHGNRQRHDDKLHVNYLSGETGRVGRKEVDEKCSLLLTHSCRGNLRDEMPLAGRERMFIESCENISHISEAIIGKSDVRRSSAKCI